ncbi:MAG: tetratricopeptide repeat protein [Promethearchaeota archaeon]|jgi:tetratricopeptide (TPR) repeat protein
MLQKKKKLTKKEIKEDKLVSFVNKTLTFFEEYKSKILTYGLIAIGVIAAIYFYLNQKMEENVLAGTELSRVMNIYEQGSYLEAIEGRQGSNIVGFKKIVEEYGGTENGESAKIYLANCYSFLGNYDEAIKYYEDYSGNIDYFKAASLAGIAGYKASNGNYEKAAGLYLDASKVSESNSQNSDYLFNAGLNYLKIGNKEMAKDLFTKVKDEYSTSLARREVDNYISQVN